MPGRLKSIEKRVADAAMDKEQLERVNRALAPWMPARRIHRHLVMGLIGFGMIPLLRPDMHMEFLLLAWLALPFTSPRVRAAVTGWLRR
jgi:hypothetical protein